MKKFAEKILITLKSPSSIWRGIFIIFFATGIFLILTGARACERKMVLVPEGPSWVGCNPSAPDPFGEPCKNDQLPFHLVYLSSFLIDRTEVPFEEYRKCVAAGACHESLYEHDPNLNSDDQPAVGVNWVDATAYCEWSGKRLPTEAEWEKAARGPFGFIYPWGNEWEPTYANWDEGGAYDGYTTTAPVDSFEDTPSPYGTVNMAGNVWEWVSDIYDPEYYSYSPLVNPKGAESGDLRILKGGAWEWDFYETRLRTYHRDAQCFCGLSDHVGFRCATDIDLPHE